MTGELLSKRRRRIALIALAAITLLALGGWLLLADVLEQDDAAGRVPLPAIPSGLGEECVADTDFMRHNHMTMLKHQRDETMLRGVRSKQYSLKECVACHAVAGGDGMFVTASDPKHFCRFCHDYVAVKIDCFQCHASRPDPDAVAAGVENE